MIAITILFTIAENIFCRVMGWGGYWYISTHLLVVGMIWAVYEKQIIAFIQKYYYWVLGGTLLVYIIDLLIEPMGIANQVYNYIITIVCVLLVLLLSMKLKVGNKIINFLGTISLEIYLCHGLFQVHLFKILFPINNEVLYFIATMACTIVFAWGFHLFDKWLIGKIRITS